MKHKKMKEWIEVALLSLGIFFLLYLLFWPVEIIGDSMRETLRDHDRVIISRALLLVQQPKAGDLVICRIPDQDMDVIKRIVGLPGQHIQITDGQVYADGLLLAEEYLADAYTKGQVDIQLEADMYFVIGDNRENSYDSRAVGPIHRDMLIGKVLLRFYPFNSLRVF